MLVPTIETDRLRLRGHRMADARACAAMWADPAVAQHASHGRGHAREATRATTAIDAANGPSLRLARHLGFEPFAEYDTDTSRAFGRPRHGVSP